MSTTPERDLPDNEPFVISPAIDEAISAALTAWYDFGYQEGREAEKVIAKQAQYELRHAILAALEPDQALRERCERLRRIVAIEAEYEDEQGEPPDAVYAVWKENYRAADLADNLTATSSAHEGREE